MALSDNARAALVGLVGTGAALLLFRGFSDPMPREPAAAVPKDSFLVATIDAAELRRSPIYQVLAGKEGLAAARSLGMKGLAEACGFEPLDRVERLAIAVPEDGDKGEFGLAAKVEVTREELERCTRALSAERGGEAETRDVGSFVVLESGGSSRIAYGKGGLLVVGRGGWLDAMLKTADGKGPGVADAKEHTALRASLTTREGWRTPTILATAILPRSLRDRLRHEMAGEDPSASTMGGVLGVSSVGVALKAGGSGRLVELQVELLCDTAEQCGVVDKLIQKKRLDWSKDLSLRLVGIGPVVDGLVVESRGPRVLATTSASADALASAIERLLKLRGRREPDKELIDPAVAPKSARLDETLRARDAGADR